MIKDYYKELYKYCYLLISNRQDAEDLLHDALLIALESNTDKIDNIKLIIDGLCTMRNKETKSLSESLI